jgi:hypothetical protein
MLLGKNHKPHPESLAEKSKKCRKVEKLGDFGPVVIPSRLRFDEGAQHVLDQNHPQTLSA